MKKESRIVCLDKELGVEAYTLEGIVQAFPNHLHDFYVIGLMISGKRYLSCKNQEYELREGDLILFNPGDNHTCAHVGKEPLHYLGMNIPRTVMQDITQEIMGKKEEPYFSSTMIRDDEIASYFRLLHENIMNGVGEFENEELLFFMISKMIDQYYDDENQNKEYDKELDEICTYMKEHYMENISLDTLCKLANLSKSSLLRVFTKKLGMTPYRYLQSVRISMAKNHLERGEGIMDAALHSGFTDQSHFSRFFTMFIGITPGAYREIFIKENRKEKCNESKG